MGLGQNRKELIRVSSNSGSESSLSMLCKIALENHQQKVLARIQVRTHSELMLDLSKNFLGQKHAPQELVQMLENAPKHLKSLNLSWNSLHFQKRFQIVADVISTRFSATLETLNLAGNKLNERSIPDLIALIHSLRQLKHLDFSDNRFGDCQYLPLFQELLNSLPKQQLQTLKIANNNLKRVHLILLGECFKARSSTLLHVDISSSKDSIAKAISPISCSFLIVTLKSLNISRCEIDSNGIGLLVPILSKFILLEELNLAENTFSPCSCIDIAKILKELKQLKILNLSGNYIGYQGISLLIDSLSGIKQLDLSFNRLGDKAFETLISVGFMSLVDLNISNNYIKSEHLFRQAATYFIGKLATLDLSHNPVLG